LPYGMRRDGMNKAQAPEPGAAWDASILDLGPRTPRSARWKTDEPY